MYFIDLHADTFSEYSKIKAAANQTMKDCEVLKASPFFLQQGKHLLQTYSIFMDETKTNNLSTAYEKQLSLIHTFIEDNQPTYCLVQNKKDLRSSIKEEKCSILISLEGTAALPTKHLAKAIRKLNQDGIRMINLVWNHKTSFAYPNCIENNGGSNLSYEDITHGLTEKGKELLFLLEKEKIIVDVSHLSDAGFWDVVNYSSKPFLASHSNCRHICRHPRNLSDSMIRNIGNRQGIVGLTFCPTFLNPSWQNNYPPTASLSHFSMHLRHLIDTGGIEIAALGTDYDGYEGTFAIPDTSHMKDLYDQLQKDGFTTNELDHFFYKNALSFLSFMLPE